jgi:DNA-directed RNA polymerase subunit RPC12/RpoP
MVELECLACGKVIKLPSFTDTDHYDGQVVCQKCKSLLHVKLVKGKVQKYKIVEKPNPTPLPSFVFQLPDGMRLTPGELAMLEKYRKQKGDDKEDSSHGEV